MERLPAEEREQRRRVAEVAARLEGGKDRFFRGMRDRKFAISTFVQLCLARRVVLSPSDAMLCAEFVLTLTRIGTIGFSSILCFDKVEALSVRLSAHPLARFCISLVQGQCCSCLCLCLAVSAQTVPKRFRHCL
jgi:Transcription factor/nuclear export subunit protein 2